MFSALMKKVEVCIIKTIQSVELPIATAWKIKQTQIMSASNVYAPLVYHITRGTGWAYSFLR